MIYQTFSFPMTLVDKLNRTYSPLGLLDHQRLTDGRSSMRRHVSRFRGFPVLGNPVQKCFAAHRPPRCRHRQRGNASRAMLSIYTQRQPSKHGKKCTVTVIYVTVILFQLWPADFFAYWIFRLTRMIPQSFSPRGHRRHPIGPMRWSCNARALRQRRASFICSADAPVRWRVEIENLP